MRKHKYYLFAKEWLAFDDTKLNDSFDVINDTAYPKYCLQSLQRIGWIVEIAENVKVKNLKNVANCVISYSGKEGEDQRVIGITPPKQNEIVFNNVEIRGNNNQKKGFDVSDAYWQNIWQSQQSMYNLYQQQLQQYYQSAANPPAALYASVNNLGQALSRIGGMGGLQQQPIFVESKMYDQLKSLQPVAVKARVYDTEDDLDQDLRDICSPF